MNRPADPTDARVQRLLEVVEQQRDRRCAEILQQAENEARQLVQQARQKARTRLHGEIQQARRQFSHQLILQQAGQAARQRRSRYRSDRALLDDAWQRLRTALERRWQDPDARRLWVDTLADRARSRLVQTGWLIEHPADWPAGERLATARRLQAWLGDEPAFTVDPGLRCGVRVRAGETVVDGSCEGLLRDRAHIEAQLLAALREAGHG